jgi:hypothetical protein
MPSLHSRPTTPALATALLLLGGLAIAVALPPVKEFVYVQSTGQFTLNGEVVGTGYSGHGDSVNNPAMEKVRDVGPIPAGLWRIGPAFDHPTKGPTVFRLTPEGHDAHGRNGFLIHGDNRKRDRSASNGCIILGPDARKFIARSGITHLRVVQE